MSELHERIEKIIEEEINPALSQHNGYAELVAVEDMGNRCDVMVNFMGGCRGCPSSVGSTLKSIELYLQEELKRPEVKVINVDSV